MMSNVTVTFTRRQAEAVVDALAYFTAGEPGDVGLPDTAEGVRAQACADRAHDRLAAALHRRR